MAADRYVPFIYFKPLYKVILIPSFLLLFSCDPYYRAEVVNESNHDVTLEIHWDRTMLEEVWDGAHTMIFWPAIPNMTTLTILASIQSVLSAHIESYPISDFHWKVAPPIGQIIDSFMK